MSLFKNYKNAVSQKRQSTPSLRFRIYLFPSENFHSGPTIWKKPSIQGLCDSAVCKLHGKAQSECREIPKQSLLLERNQLRQETGGDIQAVKEHVCVPQLLESILLTPGQSRGILTFNVSRGITWHPIKNPFLIEHASLTPP